VYTATRISPNNIVTSEMQSLDGSKILFELADTVIDASDYFLGPGNNGRDCIVKSADYNENIVNCFFQNNVRSYFASDYLKGTVVTNGIARYVNKYTFDVKYYNGVNSSNGYLVTMNPLPTADYDFFVDLSGSICPRLISVEYDLFNTSCQVVHLAYNRSVVKSIDVKNKNGTITRQYTFLEGATYFDINIDEGQNLINMNGNDCFYLSCTVQVEVHTVDVSTPNFQVITNSDINSFNGNIDLYSDLNYTLNGINNITNELDDARQKLLNISAELLKLNFNVSDTNPYGNFTDLRDRLNYLLGIMNNSPSSSTNNTNSTTPDSQTTDKGVCGGGAFSTVSCFFQDFAVGIITTVVVLGLVIGLYFLLEKNWSNE